MNKKLTEALPVTHELARQFREEVQSRWGASVEQLVAPYEADAQLAALARSGEVDAVVTRDGDFLAYLLPPQPRPTLPRPITCFPDFTFQKAIPRRCRLVAPVLEYSANLRDPSPSRSINRSTRLEAARRLMSVQAKAKQSCNARWAHDSYTCWRSNHLYWYEFAVATRCSRRRGNNKLQQFIEMHTDKRQCLITQRTV